MTGPDRCGGWTSNEYYLLTARVVILLAGWLAAVGGAISWHSQRADVSFTAVEFAFNSITDDVPYSRVIRNGRNRS